MERPDLKVFQTFPRGLWEHSLWKMEIFRDSERRSTTKQKQKQPKQRPFTNADLGPFPHLALYLAKLICDATNSELPAGLDFLDGFDRRDPSFILETRRVPKHRGSSLNRVSKNVINFNIHDVCFFFPAQSKIHSE